MFMTCTQDDTGGGIGALERRVAAVAEGFLDTAEGYASAPIPAPQIVVETTPSLIFYAGSDDGRSFVVVPRWEELGEGQALFESWAEATGGAYDGRAFFEETFNWFLVVHELGHHLQARSDSGPRSRWEEELQANEIAVAYFGSTDRARLDAFMAAVAQVRDTLDVPEGAGDAAYFEREYDAIGEIPEVYGYFQFGFFLDAWSRIDELDLATIVRDDLAL